MGREFNRDISHFFTGTKRSAEYLITGQYEADDQDNTIFAYGFGGHIDAKGGNDKIYVGSLETEVFSGTGDDLIKAGAGLLKVVDSEGKLTVQGGAGKLELNKTGSGDVDVTTASGIAEINHQGDTGHIEFSGVTGHNTIKRDGLQGDIIVQGGSLANEVTRIHIKGSSYQDSQGDIHIKEGAAYQSIVSNVAHGDISFKGIGGYNSIVRSDQTHDVYHAGLDNAQAIPIENLKLTQATYYREGHTPVVLQAIPAQFDDKTYFFIEKHKTHTLVHEVVLQPNTVKKELNYAWSSWETDQINDEDIASINPRHDARYREIPASERTASLQDLHLSETKQHTFTGVQESLRSIEKHTGLYIQADQIEFGNATVKGFIDSSQEVTAQKSRVKPHTFVYSLYRNHITQITEVTLYNDPKTHELISYTRTWLKPGDYRANLQNEECSIYNGYQPIHSKDPLLSHIHYTAHTENSHQYKAHALSDTLELRHVLQSPMTDAHFAGASGNRVNHDDQWMISNTADASQIELTQATIQRKGIKQPLQVQAIASIQHPHRYFFAFYDHQYTKVVQLDLHNQSPTGALSYDMRAWHKAETKQEHQKTIASLHEQDSLEPLQFKTITQADAFELRNVEFKHQKSLTIEGVTEGLTENQWVAVEGLDIDTLDMQLKHAQLSQTGQTVQAQKHSQLDTYVFGEYVDGKTSVVQIKLRNAPKTHALEYYATGYTKAGHHLDEITKVPFDAEHGYQKIISQDQPLCSQLHYQTDVEHTYLREVDIISHSKNQHVFSDQAQGHVFFEGEGAANVIRSSITEGDVDFKGAGVANIIEHSSLYGDTSFEGLGAGNVIHKTGQSGQFKVTQAGLVNVLVNEVEEGQTDIYTASAANFILRNGAGAFKAVLAALGNVSVHIGDGSEDIKQLGGFNSHIHIGDGDHSWYTAGGFNINTLIGYGALKTIMAGGANILNQKGSGNLDAALFGAGNVVTQISPNLNRSTTRIVGLGGANIITKLAHGEVDALLGGGINVLNHIGKGSTRGVFLGGGNLINKIGNGSASVALFSLGNIMNHLGHGATKALMAAPGNIFNKVGKGKATVIMAGGGNIFNRFETGHDFAIMGGIANLFTKIGDGDTFAAMLAEANIMTQIGDGNTKAVMLGEGNALTRIGQGNLLAAMLAEANIITQWGEGDAFAVMAAEANIFTKVGKDKALALLLGEGNVLTHIDLTRSNRGITGAVMAGETNIMTRVGNGKAVSLMLSDANVMNHIGHGLTAAVSIAQANLITKVGDGTMAVAAAGELNMINHVGQGTTAAVVGGEANAFTKIGDGAHIGLLFSETGNLMTHIGDDLTIGLTVGKANVVTQLGDGTFIAGGWGEANVFTQINRSQSDQYAFAQGKANIISKVGIGQGLAVVKGDINLINHIHDGDSYVGAWGDLNSVTKVGDGTHAVLARGRGNIITKVGSKSSYYGVSGEANIITKIGDDTQVSIAQGKENVNTVIGDGLSVTAQYGKFNINTKVGRGTSVYGAIGDAQINSHFGDGTHVHLSKGDFNFDLHVGNGTTISSIYGKCNISIKVGQGDYYSLNLSPTSSLGQMLSSLLSQAGQTGASLIANEAISYFVHGDEANTSGFIQGRSAIDVKQAEKLGGFQVSTDSVSSQPAAQLQQNFSGRPTTLQAYEAPDVGADYHELEHNADMPDHSLNQHTNTAQVEQHITSDQSQYQQYQQELSKSKETQKKEIDRIRMQAESTDEHALRHTTDIPDKVKKEAEAFKQHLSQVAQKFEQLDHPDQPTYLRSNAFQASLKKHLFETAQDDFEIMQTDVKKKLSEINDHLNAQHQATQDAQKESMQHVDNAYQAYQTADHKAQTQHERAQRRAEQADEMKQDARQNAKKLHQQVNEHKRQVNALHDQATDQLQQAQTSAKSLALNPQNKTQHQAAQGSGLNPETQASLPPHVKISDQEIPKIPPVYEEQVQIKPHHQDVIQEGIDAVNRLQPSHRHRSRHQDDIYEHLYPSQADTNPTHTSAPPAWMSSARQPYRAEGLHLTPYGKDNDRALKSKISGLKKQASLFSQRASNQLQRVKDRLGNHHSTEVTKVDTQRVQTLLLDSAVLACFKNLMPSNTIRHLVESVTPKQGEAQKEHTSASIMEQINDCAHLTYIAHFLEHKNLTGEQGKKTKELGTLLHSTVTSWQENFNANHSNNFSLSQKAFFNQLLLKKKSVMTQLGEVRVKINSRNKQDVNATAFYEVYPDTQNLIKFKPLTHEKNQDLKNLYRAAHESLKEILLTEAVYKLAEQLRPHSDKILTEQGIEHNIQQVELALIEHLAQKEMKPIKQATQSLILDQLMAPIHKIQNHEFQQIMQQRDWLQKNLEFSLGDAQSIAINNIISHTMQGNLWNIIIGHKYDALDYWRRAVQETYGANKPNNLKRTLETYNKESDQEELIESLNNLDLSNFSRSTQRIVAYLKNHLSPDAINLEHFVKSREVNRAIYHAQLKQHTHQLSLALYPEINKLEKIFEFVGTPDELKTLGASLKHLRNYKSDIFKLDQAHEACSKLFDLHNALVQLQQVFEHNASLKQHFKPTTLQAIAVVLKDIETIKAASPIVQHNMNMMYHAQQQEKETTTSQVEHIEAQRVQLQDKISQLDTKIVQQKSKYKQLYPDLNALYPELPENILKPTQLKQTREQVRSKPETVADIEARIAEIDRMIELREREVKTIKQQRELDATASALSNPYHDDKFFNAITLLIEQDRSIKQREQNLLLLKQQAAQEEQLKQEQQQEQVQPISEEELIRQIENLEQVPDHGPSEVQELYATRDEVFDHDSEYTQPIAYDGTEDTPALEQPLELWQQAEVPLDIEPSSSQFDSQIIIQTEDDAHIAQGAAYLTGKHAENSVLIQMDAQGTYRVIHGDLHQIHGRVRWQLVGHGYQKNSQGKNTKFSHHNAQELAQLVQKLNKELKVKQIQGQPEHISLVGCSLVAQDSPRGFAQDFIRHLKAQGFDTRVAARRIQVSVDSTGQKASIYAHDATPIMKDSSQKVTYSWDKHGRLLANDVLVRQGVAQYEIQRQHIGLDKQDQTLHGAMKNAMKDTHQAHVFEEHGSFYKTQPEHATSFKTTGNVHISVNDGESNIVDMGNYNLAWKQGIGGMKAISFGDHNAIVHFGDGDSTHSIDISGYQAFEGVEVTIGQHNVIFNHGRSNDLMIMMDQTIPTPPLVNPFGHLLQSEQALEQVASTGLGADYIAQQDAQWNLAGAQQYVQNYAGLDHSSDVDYSHLTEINTTHDRSARGLKYDIEATMNKSFNQWLTGAGASHHTMQQSRLERMKDMLASIAINIGVGGQGGDIQVTTGQANFIFGDHIQALLDTNIGSIFGLFTEQFTADGLPATTFTYTPTDLPRQLKNQLMQRFSHVGADITLADLLNVDYTEAGRIVSRTGEPIDTEKMLQDLLDIFKEFVGEKLDAFTDLEKLLEQFKASLSLGQAGVTDFMTTHGFIKEDRPTVSEENDTSNTQVSSYEQEPEQEFGFNSLHIKNLFNLFAHLKDGRKLTEKWQGLKKDLIKDVLHMQESTYDFLLNSGYLKADGDLHVALSNYNFNWSGDGDDLGAYLGDNNNHWGGRGDDAYYSIGTSNLFSGGEGNDHAVLLGRENTFFGGRGDDSAIVAGRLNTVNMGEGNDRAFVFGQGGMIHTDSGNDYVVVTGQFNRVNTGTGQDYSVTIGHHNHVCLAEGNDIARVFGNYNNIDGGQGNDTITVWSHYSIIKGGEGDDRFILESSSQHNHIEGGMGRDEFHLGGYQNVIDGGAGIDRFIVNENLISNRICQIEAHDQIVFDGLNWDQVWYKKLDNDLVLYTARTPAQETSKQAQFESVGTLTLEDYFDGNRAQIVLKETDKEQVVLADTAVDQLIHEMSAFESPLEGEGSSINQSLDATTYDRIHQLYQHTQTHQVVS